MKLCQHNRMAVPTHPPAYQSAYSLISMLTGIAISIFIMAAAGKIYLQSKQVFEVRAALSSVNENGRFAIQELRRIIAMTGMGIRGSEMEDIQTAPILPLDNPSFSDALMLRYRRGSTCGRYIDLDKSTPPAAVSLKVKNSQLQCRLDGGRFQPLVSGIKILKILPGVDDTNDGYANRYLTIDEVRRQTALMPDIWQRVVSLRIGILVFSSDYRLPVSMRSLSTTRLQLPGMSYRVLAGDPYLYKVFSTTIYLRNMQSAQQIR